MGLYLCALCLLKELVDDNISMVQKTSVFFFPFLLFGIQGDSVVFLCFSKNSLCVHVQFASAQIFHKRLQIFQFYVGVFLYVYSSKSLLLKASLRIVDAEKFSNPLLGHF